MSHPENLTLKESQEIPGILRIGVDLDANVNDIDTWVCRLVKRGLGVDVRSILEQRPVNFWLDDWPEIKAIPNGPAFIKELFRKSFIYDNAIPIEGAIEKLNQWREQRHQIWFITARSEETLGQETLNWFERNSLAWGQERIFFSDGDRVEFKTRQSQNFDLHLLIEDPGPPTREAGSLSIMAKLVLKYPWNMAEEIGFQAIYLNNWQEMDEMVQTASCWHYFLFSQNVNVAQY